jgi:hypothetical protein
MKRKMGIVPGWLLILLSSLIAQDVKGPSEADVKKAEAKLAEKPDDPDANLTLGKYFAFTKSEWDKALPLLVKGSDSTLKTLAEHEGQSHDNGPEKVAMGDEWIAAEKKFPKERKKLEDRAVAWYAKAWPDLDAVWKEKMRGRFHKIAGLPATFDKPNKGASAIRGWSIPSELWESYIFQGFGHEGRACAQILPAGKKNEAGYTGFHSNTMPAFEGKTYHISFWCFTEKTDTDGTLSVRYLDAAGKLIAQSGPFIPPDCPWWQRIEGDFKCPAGASRLDLNFTMNSKAGATFIDDVSVVCDGKDLLQNCNPGFEER